MSPLSLKDAALGFPPVALLVVGGCGYYGRECLLYGLHGGPFGVAACAWVAWQTLKSLDRWRRRFVWRRECMAMAGQVPSGASIKKPRPALAVALMIAMWIGIIFLSDQPEQPIAIGFGVVALVAAIGVAILLARGLWWLVRRIGNRPCQSRPVTVAIHRPAMAVPSLRSAYQALPPYAKTLLKGRR